MAGEQPRQPKDMQGLLKFCLEATRVEDAPAADPEHQLEVMGPERRAWLEEAIQNMSVDVVEQLGNGIKVLLDPSVDLDTKEEVLDCLEDWLGTIDMACNFHKIGGFAALRQCLASPHASTTRSAISSRRCWSSTCSSAFLCAPRRPSETSIPMQSPAPKMIPVTATTASDRRRREDFTVAAGKS